jgi:hypothetical protein
MHHFSLTTLRCIGVINRWIKQRAHTVVANQNARLFMCTGSSVGRGGRPGRLPGAQAGGGAGGRAFSTKRGGQGRRQGGCGGAEAPETWDGGPRQGCRQGNGGLVVGWLVACGKNVKSY